MPTISRMMMIPLIQSLSPGKSHPVVARGPLAHHEAGPPLAGLGRGRAEQGRHTVTGVASESARTLSKQELQ